MTFFQNTLDYFQGAPQPRLIEPTTELNNTEIEKEPYIDLPIPERERGVDIPPSKKKIEPDVKGIYPLGGNDEESSEGVDIVESIERLQLKLEQFENVLGLGKTGKTFEAFSRIPLPDFSKPTHSLLNPYHSRTIDTVFNHIKYDPRGSTRIAEFLTSLTEAQKHCPVSREDFLRLLLSKCSGRALELVTIWSRSKHSIEHIYKGLFDAFDDSFDSSEIRKLLSTYKFPRYFKLRIVLAELQILISQALRAGSTETEGILLMSILLQDTLRQCMPMGANKIINVELNKLKRCKLREPHVNEIVEALLEQSSEIDFEIQSATGYQFGPPREPYSLSDRKGKDVFQNKKKVSFFKRAKVNSLEGSTFKKGNVSSEPKKVYSRPTPTPSFSRPNSTPSSTRPNSTPSSSKFTPRGGNSNNKPAGSNNRTSKGPNMSKRKLSFNSNKAMDKFKKFSPRRLSSCSLCGSLGHEASETCYSIVDNNFRIFEGPPSQIHCSNCYEKLNKRFYHIVKFCPLRTFMIESYKKGLFTPRGIFKKYYLEHHA